ncbi:MAG: hypothetical protein ABI777_04670 [Betaproteobacteria bacterium]
METTKFESERNLNRDPITGAPGAHPVGTGLGAAAGGLATGAAVGAVAGPVGAAAGALVGAVIGGLAGKGVAEMIDPTAEEAYWRENYATRPYVESGARFDDYGPAYRYGVDSYGRLNGGTFDDAQPRLMRDWENAKGTSRLTWDKAKYATRDSWQRVNDAVERLTPGDSDHDGK